MDQLSGPVIGSHMSIAKGLDRTAQNAVELHANTMQFFSRNPRGSSFRTPSPDEIRTFQKIRQENRMGPLLAHAPYTMNLAGSQASVSEFARMVIREDLSRMNALGIELFVFHPGSHTGAGTAPGIQRIIDGLNQAVTGQEHTTILLETMSGKGTEIGSRFEELRAIRDGLQYPQRVGICLDTCHVFSAGYDIVHDLDGVLSEFDRVLGLSLLKAVHLNDSMTPFASHKDRHAVLGTGTIGLDAILRLMRHPALKNIPFFLETPLDDRGHAQEIDMLRKYLTE